MSNETPGETSEATSTLPERLQRWLSRCGNLLAHLVLVRVPALGLALLCLLPLLALRGQATVENVFNLDTSFQLFVATLMAVIAVVFLGHALILAWQQGPKRAGIEPIRLPVFRNGDPMTRAILLTLGVASVLLLPFFYALFVKAEASANRLYLFLGALCGLVVIAASLFVVEKCRDKNHWFSRHLDVILRFLGPGYWEDDAPLPGHKLSAVFALLLGGLYLVFWLPYSPQDTAHLPAALPFVVFFITLVCVLLGGVAFFVDRWRIPVLLLLLGVALVFNAIHPRSHEFEVTYLDGPATATPAPEPGRVLTVIAADGGGIQAAAWSAQVLTSLQTELGDEFTDSIQLISSVSGGSVGTYFYLAGAAHDGARGPVASSRECVRRAAAASSLGATAWGLVGPDFQRLVFPFVGSPTFDRGWAIEQAWTNTARRMRESIDGVGEGSVGDTCAERFESWHGDPADPEQSLRVSELREKARRGELPHVVFNSTVVNNGEQAFFTTVDPASIGCQEGDACWDLRQLDLRAATAARLSATFPFVTPIARPEQVPGKDFIRWSVADGGYFDNFGSFAAIRWLRSLDEDLLRSYDKVVLVQILTFPQNPERRVPSGSEGFVFSTLGPLQALVAVRTSSQLERTRVELDMLAESISGRMGEVEAPAEKLGEAPAPVPKDPRFQLIELRPPFSPGQNAPLSWHLSKANIKVIRDQWQELCRKEVRDDEPEKPSEMTRLRNLFGVQSPTCDDGA